MRKILAGAALLLLAACQTTTSGRIGPTPAPVAEPPATDAPVCPAELTADVPAEPLPPAGVSQAKVVQALRDALGEAVALDFWRWVRVEYPTWARELSNRLQAGHDACVNKPAPKGG